MYYELINLLYAMRPFIVVLVSLISGVILTNFYYRRNLVHYIETEKIQVMEFQKNKIAELKKELDREKDANRDMVTLLKRIKEHDNNVQEII